MHVVRSSSENGNHESWTIHSSEGVSNLVIEPQIDQVNVRVKVNNISFVKTTKNARVGDISATSVNMSQKCRIQLEYKEDCLKISPNWGDVTLIPEIDNIEVGSKFSKILIEPEIRSVSVKPTIRSLKISNNIENITFGHSLKQVRIEPGRKTIQFNQITGHRNMLKVLKISPIIQEIELCPVIDLIQIVSSQRNWKYSRNLSRCPTLSF